MIIVFGFQVSPLTFADAQKDSPFHSFEAPISTGSSTMMHLNSWPTVRGAVGMMTLWHGDMMVMCHDVILAHGGIVACWRDRIMT
jgi:hypothetical protein